MVTGARAGAHTRIREHARRADERMREEDEDEREKSEGEREREGTRARDNPKGGQGRRREARRGRIMMKRWGEREEEEKGAPHALELRRQVLCVRHHIACLRVARGQDSAAQQQG